MRSTETFIYNCANGVQYPGCSLAPGTLSLGRQYAHRVRWPGAQGGCLIGPWGANVVRDSLLVGVSENIHMNFTEVMDGHSHSSTGKRRLIGGGGGLWHLEWEIAAFHRLTVDSVAFAEFDHPRTVAVTLAQRDSQYLEGWEVRFRNIRWSNAPNRAFWMWSQESVFVDEPDFYRHGILAQALCEQCHSGRFPCLQDRRSFDVAWSARMREHAFRSSCLNNMMPENALKNKDLMIGYSGGRTLCRSRHCVPSTKMAAEGELSH